MSAWTPPSPSAVASYDHAFVYGLTDNRQRHLNCKKMVVIEKTDDGKFVCAVPASGKDMVGIVTLSPQNFVRVNPAKGASCCLDFKPRNLGGGRLVVTLTDGDAFRFQVFDSTGVINQTCYSKLPIRHDG